MIPKTTVINLPRSQNLNIEPQFDRIIIQANQPLPENLDLHGCLAFTRDTKHVGLLHKLIFLIQRTISFLYRKNHLFDYHLAHGFIVIDKDTKKKDHLVIAHSVFDGMRTASRNYLNDKDVTQVVIYRPRKQNVRDLIARYGQQTSYTNPQFLPEDQRAEAALKSKGEFSIPKMIASFFVKQTPRKKADKRISYFAADLLLGNQIKSVSGKKQEAMFCAPYALSVVQGSLLIDAMTIEEQTALKNLNDRAKIAQIIFQRFQKKTQDTISKAYWENKIVRIKTNYAMSAHIGEVLNMVSEPLNLQVQSA